MTKRIQEYAAKAVQTEFAARNAFEREAIFDRSQTFRAASRESNGEENLKQLLQEFARTAVQTEFAVLHAFEREVTF